MNCQKENIDKTETLQTICIMCPMGCNIEIVKCGDEISVSGQTCKRGETYGKAEITAPVRMVTSLVKYKDSVTSVKTENPIPKEKISEVLKEIKAIHVKHDLCCGDIIIEDVAKTGVNIVVTGNIC